MSARKYLRSGLVLTFGSVAASLCSFVRNIIVARLISVEDFGIAATFAMTMSLVEMASNLGVDRMIVQASDGENPQLQATAQAFQVLRGLLASVVLFAIAAPVALLFKISEVTWAFRLLAVVPLIRSFAHFDIVRLQRSMRFGPSVWANTGPQIAAMLLAAPLALWLQDYRVMLFLVLFQVAAATIISHLTAERHYHWAWDRVQVRRIIGFGWPLLIDSMLMFFILQGDRAIVGAAFDMEVLGWYSAGLAITMMSGDLIARVIRPFFLPLLSRFQESPSSFNSQYRILCWTAVCAAILVGVLFTLGGESLIRLIFGDRYAPVALVLPWFAVLQSIRIIRIAPSVAALSLGSTTNLLVANLAYSLSTPFAITLVVLGYGPPAVAACAVVGELLALGTAVGLLKSTNGVPMSFFVRPFVILIGCMTACVIIRPSFAASVSLPLQFGLACLLAILSAVLILAFEPVIRNSLYERVSRFGPALKVSRASDADLTKTPNKCDERTA